VSSANRQKRVENRQSRQSAVEEARRRARLRRIEVAAGGIVLAIIVAIVFVVHSNNSNKSSTATTTTVAGSTTTVATTTTTALPSAAGKPCVAVTSPLPTGAPAVPVQTGPPPTKLVTKDIKVGTGAVVKANATVTVNYVGVSCSTGVIFDSSYKDGGPATFPLSGVIPGWTQGIPGMKVGGERLLGIPPSLGYGASGQPPSIAPNETLWFVVEVLKTK
jgi:peptidylprolyl isomerase